MNRPTATIKERLREALDIKNMTQQELSDKTGIPKASISQYLSGYAKPKSDRIYAISSALGINEAWLLGFDVPINESYTQIGNKAIMAKNIQYYMDIHNKTRNEMCDALGVKYTTFTDWVKGNSYPRIDKIELMANYFGISKADLVEEHTTDNTFPLTDTFEGSPMQLEHEEMEHIKKYRTLDTHGKEMVDFTLDKEYERCAIASSIDASVDEVLSKRKKRLEGAQ